VILVDERLRLEELAELGSERGTDPTAPPAAGGAL
jgi:hypothetical protein